MIYEYRMKFSIIIPNYNKAKFIDEAISSVLNQTYHNFEIVIIDDHSTDNSWSIIQKQSTEHEKIRAFQPKHKLGGAGCRNLGLSKAVGEYIIFLDSDDLLVHNCLEKRLRCFERKPRLDFIVFTGGTFFSQPGDSVSRWIPAKGNHLKNFLSHDLPWNISMPLWKASFLKKLGGFDTSFPRLQDVEMHTRALLVPNVKYEIVKDKPDFYYRIDEERKLVDPYHFIENFVDAVEIFCLKFDEILRKKGKNKLIKELNGTYQSAFILIQNQFDAKAITNEQRNMLFAKVNQFKKIKGLYLFYVLGLKARLHKVKGYNWLFKKLLRLL